MTGTMTDYSNTTVTASAVTNDGTYATLTIPSNGYYTTNSKITALSSKIGASPLKINLSNYDPTTGAVSTMIFKIPNLGYNWVEFVDNDLALTTFINGVQLTKSGLSIDISKEIEIRTTNGVQRNRYLYFKIFI